MEPSALAELVKEGGPWGVVVVLLSVIGILWKFSNDRMKDQTKLYKEHAEASIALTDKVATILANSSATWAANVTAAGQTRELIQQSIDVTRAAAASVEALTKQVEQNAGRLDRIYDVQQRQRS